MYGTKIKNYLDQNGIKYTHISTLTGIPLNTFSAMLNSKRKITVEEYFKICCALNVDANYFYEQVSKAS